MFRQKCGGLGWGGVGQERRGQEAPVRGVKRKDWPVGVAGWARACSAWEAMQGRWILFSRWEEVMGAEEEDDQVHPLDPQIVEGLAHVSHWVG